LELGVKFADTEVINAGPQQPAASKSWWGRIFG